MSSRSNPASLDELAALARPEIEALWTRTFASPLPRGLSVALARPILAHALQSRERGGLARETRAALRRALAGKEAPRRARMRPGSQFIREWNGVVHRVEVTEDGFLWQGETHHSLSAIARAITGARWSGPRFFRLPVAPSKPARKEP